ncbi:MAG: 2-oxoacid:acceptor oxidoreductase subunit alpha [Planctomycetes bacterium]|nr:2-oxoacid:acceptor oxidoreductase subunit alpha [Planctomycetota bacterium]
MSARKFDFAVGIGGAAGQGIEKAGSGLAGILARRGLHLYAYNAYQSIIRGGHIFLTLRASDQKIYSHGDKLDLLLCLNQDTMDRHLRQMGPGSRVLYNSDAIKPGEAGPGVQLCPFPFNELTNNNRNKIIQNTVAVGMIFHLLGLDIQIFADVLTKQFKRKGQSVVDENVGAARAGYEHAKKHYQPFPDPAPAGVKPLAVTTGNQALAMGGAAAGVKFYCAYPMSPSTGVLVWMAANARDLGIMVRQVEDEIGVMCMAIGAAHAGCRAMCATSGGGFALMTEAIGMAGMMEVPVVVIDVQRAGPSTGVPTKTEQGDLWQALGASQGDYPRFIVAPTGVTDAFNTVPELFNLVDHYQCPGIVLSDLLISEGTYTIDPGEFNFHPKIDRGELITEPSATDGYKRYRFTESGVSPRAIPGLEGYVHVVATDEHDEDGVLISDEYTNPHKRQAMMEKRMRKVEGMESAVPAPKLEGAANADVTLVGWGSTYGVIREALEQLQAEGVSANHLPIKWIVPFHGKAVTETLKRSKRVIVVENNYSGLFYRYMRSETGLTAHGHIRKYDGEPFMPHHIVQGVLQQMAGKTDLYVPVHEMLV